VIRTLVCLFAVLFASTAAAAPLYSTSFEFTLTWDGNSNTPTVTGDPVPNLLHSDNLNINSFGVVFDFNDMQVKNLNIVNNSEDVQDVYFQVGGLNGKIGSATMFSSDFELTDPVSVNPSETATFPDSTLSVINLDQLIISWAQPALGNPFNTFATDTFIRNQMNAWDWNFIGIGGLGSLIVGVDANTNDELPISVGAGTEFIISGNVFFYIPEPSSLVLAVMAGVGLIFWKLKN